jgi:hypothetical protein
VPALGVRLKVFLAVEVPGPFNDPSNTPVAASRD